MSEVEQNLSTYWSCMMSLYGGSKFYYCVAISISVKQKKLLLWLMFYA